MWVLAENIILIYLKYLLSIYFVTDTILIAWDKRNTFFSHLILFSIEKDRYIINTQSNKIILDHNMYNEELGGNKEDRRHQKGRMNIIILDAVFQE